VDAVLAQLGTGGGALAGLTGALLPIGVEALTGVVAGALVFVVVSGVTRLRQKLR
jgi:prepilin signal peptidase PulO-like enzyme (type II secretory pathway)